MRWYLSCLLNVVCCGSYHQGFCARVFINSIKHRGMWEDARLVLDILFYPIETEHCRKSWQYFEKQRRRKT